jgi:ribonuclease HI
MSSFYAIAVGEKRGVFTSWNDCKPFIENYKGAIYKKFSTLEEATNFVQEYSNKLYVYTDGACINNGSPNARAGIGIYFSKDNPLNVSKELKGAKVTNNIAELTAVIEAIQLIKDMKMKDKIIVTDSEYVIKCATTYGKKLEERDWKQKKDKIIPNLELVREVYELSRTFDIKYKHIQAHTDNKDRHSIGNYYADLLANKSINNDSPKEIKTKPKIYLKVSYQQKDEAKALGARWDATKKQWYIFDDNKNKEELLAKYK